MKLGVLLAGRRPEDIAQRLGQARDGGFSLCQLNLMQSGFNRGDLVTIADAMLDFGIRPVAVGCYVNPLSPGDSGFMGACRADLDLLLGSLDIIGARRIVLCSGTRGLSWFDEHEANSTEESAHALREFLADVVKNTRARHYTLVLEPWKTHVLSSVERVTTFNDSLPPAVAERVRYALDATSLITTEQYAERDQQAVAGCEQVGPLTNLVHLRDIAISADGEETFEAPGQGALDYRAYVTAIMQHTAPDAVAIIRNAAPGEYAGVRDFLLRLSDQWQLA